MEQEECLDFDEEEEVIDKRFLRYPIIELHVLDPEGSWCYSPLFKNAEGGGKLMWQIGFDESTQELVTVYGLYTTMSGGQGQLQTTRRKVVCNQSGLSLQQQARLEAQKKRLDKHRTGYRPYTNVDSTSKGSAEPGACLLADYEKGKTIKESDFPIAVQSKVDGMRCRIFVRSRTDEKGDVIDDVVLLSRSKVEWKWLDHIRKQVKGIFKYLPNGAGLDGELFITGVPFETLQSALRTTKTKNAYNDSVKLYIFDVIVLQTVLEDRICMLDNAMNCYREEVGDVDSIKDIQVLPMYLINSFDELEQHLTECIEAGDEGLVIRKFGRTPQGVDKTPTKMKESYYIPIRNNNTQKMKVWKDAEGKIVSVTEGEGSHTGHAIFTLEISTKKGPLRFQCEPNGTSEERKALYADRQKLIGRIYTYKYFNYMESGAPRFPKGLRFYK